MKELHRGVRELVKTKILTQTMIWKTLMEIQIWKIQTPKTMNQKMNWMKINQPLLRSSTPYRI